MKSKSMKSKREARVYSQEQPKRRITKRHVATHAVAAAVAAAAMYGATPHTTTTPTPSQAQQEAYYCDPLIWQHVYHQERFQILNPCTGVTGYVQAVKYEADADAHIQVKLDPAYGGLLNQANVQLQNGALVVEPICAKPPPTQADAIMACAGYTNEVWIPNVGVHVVVVGPYVNDNQHGWREIHAPTSITNATTP